MPLRRSLLRLPALTLLAALALAAPPAHAARFVYYCILSPLQEPGGNPGSRGTGAGRFEIDTDANTCNYRIVFSKLLGVESAAHIHGSATSTPGNPAGVLVALPAGNPKVGTWNFDETQQGLLLKGLCYTNIHSTVFPGGEIRGQIVPLLATLDGAQETPPVSTRGRGFATCTIDTVANVLSYYVQFDSLNSAEAAAHIHGNALHGTPAGVLVGLPAGSPKIGTWNYPQSEEAAILGGLTYVNIHTVTSGGGEIRGQLVPVVVPIDATQEPTAATGSEGFGCVAIDTSAAAKKLSYDVHVDSLSAAESAAHIHGFAPPGVGAGVLSPIALGARAIGTWTYGAANEANVLAGLTYFNIHTTAFPGGEIRGQITDLPSASAGNLAVGGPAYAGRGLSAAPNPFGARTSLSFVLSRTGSVSMTIVGIDGRTVRRIPATLFAPGPHSYEWDGFDDAGHTAAPGVYFAVVHTPDGTVTTRVARLR